MGWKQTWAGARLGNASKNTNAGFTSRVNASQQALVDNSCLKYAA